MDQDEAQFDPMLGSLGFLGMHAVVATVALPSWKQSIRYLTESVRVLRKAAQGASLTHSLTEQLSQPGKAGRQAGSDVVTSEGAQL